MGTWDSGLFDNDNALDAVGGACGWLHERLDALAASEASAGGAGELAAVLGLMLQFDDYELRPDRKLDQVKAAIEAQRAALDTLPDEARALIAQIERGEAEALGERRAERSEALTRALGHYLRNVREPSLFGQPAGAALTQAFAEHLADRIDADLADEDFLEMYEISSPMGRFGMLLLIEPWQLDGARFERWRKALRTALAAEEASGNEDAPFFANYVERADAGFELALARASR